MIFLYADAVGHVWGLYPRGIPGPPLFAKEYYATADCTGQAYMFGVPARYIVGVSGSGGTELGALKDTATSTMVLAQSTGIPAQCSLTNMNAVPMFATTPANMDLNIAVDTPAYQLPLHPEYVP